MVFPSTATYLAVCCVFVFSLPFLSILCISCTLRLSKFIKVVRANKMKTVLFLLSLPTVLAFVETVTVHPSRLSNRPRFFSTSSEEADRLLETASKLRQEADAIRETLGPPPLQQQALPPIVYTDLKDSSWELTYRFSRDPPSDKDEESQEPRINYSGKLTVTFKSDGYTDLLSHVPSGKNTLDITKVWGWDEEVSQEDNLPHLVFSINTNDVGNRFYWQARIDNDRNGGISLADGTVTVKKDVASGFWGVFKNASGILAQFVYVGNFGGKPVRVT